jgi:hypothetical protein
LPEGPLVSLVPRDNNWGGLSRHGSESVWVYLPAAISPSRKPPRVRMNAVSSHSPCEVALPSGQGGIASAPGDYKGGRVPLYQIAWLPDQRKKHPIEIQAGNQSASLLAGQAPCFARGG